MLVMVNDLIVHEPAVKQVADQLDSTPERVIGQLFCLAWHVNRYCINDSLSSLDENFIAQMFEHEHPDELMSILHGADFLTLDPEDDYQFSDLFRHYFVKPPEEDLKNI